MSSLLEEVQQWNSPTVSSFLLWKFTVGYCSAHVDGDAPIALMHFLAFPILTNKRLLEPVNNRRASLQSYILSFEAKKDIDVMVNIHEMIHSGRDRTMASIDMAVSRGLMVWDCETGKLYPRTNLTKPQRGNSLRRENVRNGKKAEILGRWFAQHEISAIATYLKVVL